MSHVPFFVAGDHTFTSCGSRPPDIDTEGNNKDVEAGRFLGLTATNED